MAAIVTFYDMHLHKVAEHTVVDDGSVITTLPVFTGTTTIVGFSVKVLPETGNDMVKQRVTVLENKFRRFLQDLTDAVDRLDF